VSEVLMNTLHSAVQYRLLEYSTDIVWKPQKSCILNMGIRKNLPFF
jgi:hypothetical protein